MKIISWNVNGLRAIEKKGEIDNLIKNISPDILCLQETKSEESQLDENIKNKIDTKDNKKYESFFESATNKKGYSGVGIYTKIKPENISKTLGDKKFLDNEGRTIIAEYKNFYLINIYFPNGGKSEEHFTYKLEYYKKVFKLMKKLEEKKSVILCGDVNATASEIDLARPKENAGKVGCTKVERDFLKSLGENFIDIWRKKNPEEKKYTWWDVITKSRERNVGWRIDYFYISKNLEKKVKQIEILNDVFGSDHCPILLEMEI